MVTTTPSSIPSLSSSTTTSSFHLLSGLQSTEDSLVDLRSEHIGNELFEWTRSLDVVYLKNADMTQMSEYSKYRKLPIICRNHFLSWSCSNHKNTSNICKSSKYMSFGREQFYKTKLYLSYMDGVHEYVSFHQLAWSWYCRKTLYKFITIVITVRWHSASSQNDYEPTHDTVHLVFTSQRVYIHRLVNGVNISICMRTGCSSLPSKQWIMKVMRKDLLQHKTVHGFSYQLIY